MSTLQIDSLLAGSPFLTGLANRFPDYTRGDSGAHINTIVGELEKVLSTCSSEADLKALVRTARNRAALVIAIADLSQSWSLQKVTANLTIIADACLKASVNWLLADHHRRGKLTKIDPENPSENCGYVLLAMGKQGGHELNFSSDVDVIVLFDPEIAPLAEGVEPASFFVRFTRQLVSIMQDMTKDGYAYRVDLRLRPDPRATQIAISYDAAIIYYESMGQNWERAAMIKARPVAGDLELGRSFLKELAPFIWRKYLDFAAIVEVHTLKRQIHAVKGHGEIAVLGHNVKLGRGGIREIEFFVQTQQLIAGGRNKALRGISTLLMLDELAKAEWITTEVAQELKAAYIFLRQVEHRIQMIADQQTHQLPSDQVRFDELSRFAGFETSDHFTQKLLATFRTVQSRYDELFEDGDTDNDAPDLNFTGIDDDEQTLSQLAEMGFAQPQTVSSIIKGWYAGRYQAMRSKTARERLSELLPRLLACLAQTGEPDTAFAAFDRFLSGLPTGVQLFSLLRANPQYLDLIANILGAAPRLADQMSRHPKTLDAVLEPSFFASLPERSEIAAAIAQAVPQGIAFDMVLDQARIVAREQMFRIGVRTLSDTLSAADAGRAYSDLAECLIERLLQAVHEEMQHRYGSISGGRLCVVAMGKLGGREITSASDLDLIVIYDHDEDAIASSGPKQISTSQYFARLTQRLITAMSAPTPEGVLYEVDMRLRPSGNKGPIATSISAFIDYQENSAWTWEKMALTRARVVAGDESFIPQVEDAIKACLCTPRDEKAVRKDASQMRALMLADKKPKSIWDLKASRGGIVDLEFIVQVSQIVSAAEKPQVLAQNLSTALANLGREHVIPPDTINQLELASKLYQQLSQILKLGVSTTFDPQKAPTGLINLINATTASPDIATSQALIEDCQKIVQEIFEKLVEP